MNDFSEHECIDWRNFTWLQYNGATCSHGERNFGCDLVQWVVPWSDASNDTDWFTNDERTSDFFFKFK